MSDLFKWLKLDFEFVKNPIDLLLFRLGFKNEILLKSKKLGNFQLMDNENKITSIGLFLDLQKSEKLNENKENLIKFFNALFKNENSINLNGINYLNNKEISILKESFLGEGNSPFSSDLKDKIIVDIGGNIGDTALQFAKQGAEVYSFEPVPPIYDIALKNIDLNPDLKDKIHFYNYAISNKKGEIDIAYGGEGTSAGSSTYSKKGKVYKVNTITLKDILSNLCPNVDLLQMDCEGSEYDIIPNSNLSMFKEIIIEYHQFITGIDYHVLLENLEKQGFIIDEIFPCPGEIFSINQVGIIRAINKNI